MKDSTIGRDPDRSDGVRVESTGEITRDLPSVGNPAEATLAEVSEPSNEERTHAFFPDDSPSSAARGPEERAIPLIPGYEILGELGRGGMGIVYRARNVLLNRPCALKMILAGVHADAESTLRFLGEAEVVARVRHPNVVQVHHIGQVGGLPFFELDYVPGGSLDQAFDGTPWPASRAVRLVAAVARGTAEAHRLGILHRDLKPANVLMAEDDTPKVTDFGLAKLVASDGGLTRTNSVLGSPSYMAPEQAEGKASQVGLAADVYSLGVILYELLTGRPPFKGATVLETLELVRTAEPVPPSRLVQGLTRDLETIVLKCLQKDPARRYPSAGLLVEDLRRLEAGEAILARRSSAAGRTWRWCRRNPSLAALNALAATLVIAIAIVSTVAAASLKRQRDEARDLVTALDFERRNAREAESVAKRERDRSDRLRNVSDLRLAGQLWDSDEGTARYIDGLLSQQAARKPGEADHRDLAWRFAWTRLNRSATTLLADSPAHFGSLTPDGRLVAADQQGRVTEWDLAVGRSSEVRQLGGDRPPRCLQFSPAGDLAALGDAEGATLRLRGVRDGRDRHVIAGPAPILDVAFSADGRSVAAIWGDRRARAYDVATGAERGSAPLQSGPHTCSALSQDGGTLILGGHPISAGVVAYDLRTGGSSSLKYHRSGVGVVACSSEGRLVTGDGVGKLAFWDLASGKLIGAKDPAQPGWITRLAFSTDGRRLASGGHDGLVTLWDVEGRQRVATLKGHRDSIEMLAFSSDGSSLSTGDQGGMLKVWNLDSPDGVKTLAGSADQLTRVAFTPDSTRLVSVGKVTQARDARSGATIWNLAEKKNDPQAKAITTSLAFSRDGRFLAIGDKDSRVVLREPTTGRPLLELQGIPADFYEVSSDPNTVTHVQEKRSVNTLGFSPDGSSLAAGFGHYGFYLDPFPELIKVWNLRTGATLAQLPLTNIVTWVQFSADGSTLRATDIDGRVRSWKVGSWKEEKPLEVGVAITSAATSPDGKTLVAGLFDGTIVRWELPSLREVSRVSGHSGPVFGVGFSPGGKTMVTIGRLDQTLKFWDVESGGELMSRKFNERLTGLALDPSSDLIAVASRDGGVIHLLKALPLAKIDEERAREADHAQRLDEANKSNPTTKSPSKGP